MNRFKKQINFIGFFLCISIQSFSQFFIPIQKDYFLFPILPGQQNYLAGNFGELRSNHFHCGLDIKTQYKTGLPVHAAADGFISKVSISTKGYGNTIFLTHPNGFVTVYAHLETLEPELAKIIKTKQYEQKTFEIEVTFKPNEITFNRGDIIAFSGNTGSSGGPHLHFEIRDTANNVYNPLLFGFKEIIDNIPPIVNRLIIRPMDINSRINETFSKKEFKISKIGEQYSITQNITAWGTLGFEIGAYDRQNGTTNLNGVKNISVFYDNKIVYNHEIDVFPFELASHINAHIDYETSKQTGKNNQKCYVSDGNKLNIYDRKLSGKIQISDTINHQITIKVTDANDNYSELIFNIKGSKHKTNISNFIASSKEEISTEMYENIFKVIVKGKSENDILDLYQQNKKISIQKSYTSGNETVFLYDLRKGLPDSVKTSLATKKLAFKATIPSNEVNQYYEDKFHINFQKNSLYDTLFLQIAHPIDPKIKQKIYQVNSSLTPIYSEIYFSILPEETFKNKNKVGAYVYAESGGVRYLGGNWNNDYFDFKSKYLGKYVLKEDTKAPEIKAISLKKNNIKFEIDDWPSGINYFETYINGKWVLFNYEHKQKLIWLDNPQNKNFSGELILKVHDNAGNIATFKSQIK